MYTTTLESRLRTALLLIAASLGCEEAGPRVYTAQHYDPSAGCLDEYVPLGLVQATELDATCTPVCLRVADELYTSSVCPPYPAEASVESGADSPGCRAALAALAAEIGCADAPADAGL
jgi:hypothetical protein